MRSVSCGRRWQNVIHKCVLRNVRACLGVVWLWLFYYLVYRLISWLFGWLVDFSSGFSAGQFGCHSVCRPIYLSFDRPVSQSVFRSVIRSVFRSVSRSVLSVVLSFGRSVTRLVGSLISYRFGDASTYYFMNVYICTSLLRQYCSCSFLVNLKEIININVIFWPQRTIDLRVRIGLSLESPLNLNAD